jgi:hypothetical protein
MSSLSTPPLLSRGNNSPTDRKTQKYYADRTTREHHADRTTREYNAEQVQHGPSHAGISLRWWSWPGCRPVWIGPQPSVHVGASRSISCLAQQIQTHVVIFGLRGGSARSRGVRGVGMRGVIGVTTVPVRMTRRLRMSKRASCADRVRTCAGGRRVGWTLLSRGVYQVR